MLVLARSTLYYKSGLRYIDIYCFEKSCCGERERQRQKEREFNVQLFTRWTDFIRNGMDPL